MFRRIPSNEEEGLGLALLPPLPMEVTMMVMREILDIPSIQALTATSSSFYQIIDEDHDLWKEWMRRNFSPTSSQEESTFMLHYGTKMNVVSSASSSSSPAHAINLRLTYLALHRHRQQLWLERIKPLYNEKPALVSTYFEIFEAIMTLEREEQGFVEESLLAQFLENRNRKHSSSSSLLLEPLIQRKEQVGERKQGGQCLQSTAAAAATTTTTAAPPLTMSSSTSPSIALLLALHILYRKRKRSRKPLGPWITGRLQALAQEPRFVGHFCLAYWQMGSLSHYGFRSRDILRVERVDVRRIASLILAEGVKATAAAATASAMESVIGNNTAAKGPPSNSSSSSTEQQEEWDDKGGELRFLQKLDSLKGITTTYAALDPAALYHTAKAEDRED